MSNSLTKTDVTPRSTKSELSRSLKIHRSQLDGFLNKTGAPAPDAKKRYDVREVAAFISAQGGANSLDTLRGARLEEVKLRCEKLRRELDRDAGKTVLRSDVDELHGKMALRLKSLLYSKLENEMPPKMAGCDALALRRYGRELADELVTRLGGDIDQWVTV
ncbi:MAG: hypothetical protein H7343_11050 [Undibacterium sp.]|nr:hypothetical protein [Opitutaceae bacterium]